MLQNQSPVICAPTHQLLREMIEMIITANLNPWPGVTWRPTHTPVVTTALPSIQKDSQKLSTVTTPFARPPTWFDHSPRQKPITSHGHLALLNLDFKSPRLQWEHTVWHAYYFEQISMRVSHIFDMDKSAEPSQLNNKGYCVKISVHTLQISSLND